MAAVGFNEPRALSPWRNDYTCSYCGGLEPARVFRAIEAGAELIDAPGAMYLGNMRRKVVLGHFKPHEQQRLIEIAHV